MARKLIWAYAAEEDLEAAASYIHRDSPVYAFCYQLSALSSIWCYALRSMISAMLYALGARRFALCAMRPCISGCCFC